MIIAIYILFILIYLLFSYVGIYHLRKNTTQLDFTANLVISIYKKLSAVLIIAFAIILIYQLIYL